MNSSERTETNIHTLDLTMSLINLSKLRKKSVQLVAVSKVKYVRNYSLFAIATLRHRSHANGQMSIVIVSRCYVEIVIAEFSVKCPIVESTQV